MNKDHLTLGSLFDGSGGFPLGGLLAGVTPIWASEIEPFPIRVTTKRLPAMKHYGDVSRLNGAELPPVDIITFGSPCQDMSIAGRRAGLDGSRSGLFHEAIRIIKEMRSATDGAYPRYIVWENVPGAFSSNGGADFRSVLEEICRIKDGEAHVPAADRWKSAGEILAADYSVAWRVFDSQYWGVPQRRKRIYLVADFAGQRAPDILFKSDGLSGYSAEGIGAWQRTACRAEAGAGEAGGGLIWCINPQGSSGVSVTENQTSALVAQDHGHHPAVLQSAGFCTEHSANARSIGYEDETAPTLRAGVVPAAMSVQHNPTDSRMRLDEAGKVQTLTGRMGSGGNNVPLVAEPEPMTLKIRCGHGCGGRGPLVQKDKSATLATNNDQTLFQPVDCKAYGVCSKSSHAMLSDNPKTGFYEAETSRTLDRGGGNPSANQGGLCILSPDPAFSLQGSMIGRAEENGPQGDGVNEDVSFTLNTRDKHAVAQPAYSSTVGGFINSSEETAQPLMARDYKDPQIVNDPQPDEPMYIVRRLVPTECARLQGFPDWWCANLGTENPTEEEIAFWAEVFETHRRINHPEGKPKTRNQIIKWLRNPHTDSAEYSMWGNGLSANISYFVLSGIVWADGLER